MQALFASLIHTYEWCVYPNKILVFKKCTLQKCWTFEIEKKEEKNKS